MDDFKRAGSPRWWLSDSRREHKGRAKANKPTARAVLKRAAAKETTWPDVHPAELDECDGFGPCELCDYDDLIEARAFGGGDGWTFTPAERESMLK